MSEKQFIVGETLREYYQIKCEKKDYSRVLAPNTVARLLNEQQELLNKRERQLHRALSFLASDVCSLSEAKFREVIKEIEDV